MEANEEKKQEYLSQLSLLDATKLVYLDESGVDESCYKDNGWGKKGEDINWEKKRQTF